MTDRKIPQPKNSATSHPKSAKQAGKTEAALSADDLDTISGGINPQPLPPGKTRVSQ